MNVLEKIKKENEKIIEMRAYLNFSYESKKFKVMSRHIAQKSFFVLLNTKEHSETDPCNLHQLVGYTINRLIGEGFKRKEIKKILGLSDTNPNATKLKGFGWREYYAQLVSIPDRDWEFKYNLQFNQNWVFRKHDKLSLKIMKGTYFK